MEDNVKLTILLMILVVGVATFWMGFTQDDVEVTVNTDELESKLDLVGQAVIVNSNKLNELMAEEVSVEEVVSGSYMLSKSEFEDQAVESEADKLATESVNSRDFKKAVYELLLNNDVENVTIDSYKDITEIMIRDSDVDKDEVEFSVKVYFFVDGDEDETMRANLVDFTVEVNDLDYDDDFDDAEVDEDYMDSLVLKRVYN